MASGDTSRTNGLDRGNGASRGPFRPWPRAWHRDMAGSDMSPLSLTRALGYA
jgi:hypothetical protein